MLIERGGVVGRARELDEISRRRLATATHGADVFCVLGDAGIGKTALLRELATQSGPGAVLLARAAAWEADQPGALLRQLLPDEPVDALLGPDSPDRLVSRLVEGGTPALLVVDDADRADTASLQVLVSAVRRHRREAFLLLLGATRLTPLLDDLATACWRLEGLSAPQLAEIAGRRGQVLHPAMADQLARHVSGNPRHALALLDDLPASLWSRPDSRLPAPAPVREEVGRQMARLGPDGIALVEALAVLDEDESLGRAADLAGLDDPLPALDQAERAGLLAPQVGGTPRLRSPLTRAAVLDLMGVQASARAHQRAAAVADRPGRRLAHLVAATLVPDAALADEVDRFARERGSEGAWAEAAGLYREASRLTDDVVLREQRLILSVDALVAAGDCHAAAALVPAVESMRETPLRNAALAYLAVVRGRAAEAELRLRRAWDIVNPERDPGAAALIAQRYVLHSLVRGDSEALVEWADRALALVGHDTAAGIEAAAIRGLGLAACGRGDEAGRTYEELSVRVRHGAQAQRVTMARGWLAGIQDDVDASRTFLEGVTSTAFLGGSSRISLWALGWLARAQFRVGEWSEALRTVEEGRTLAEGTGIVLASPLLEWTAAQVHCLRGDWDAARDTVRRADAITQGYAIMAAPAMLARAALAEAEADYAGVVRALEPLTRLAPGSAVDEPGYFPWHAVYANALVVLGRYDQADAFLTPHEQRAQERRHRSTAAQLRYARGRLLGALGDLPGARRHFDEALELLEGTPLRYDRARVAFAYGQTLRRAGRRREADEMITVSRDLWDGLGAQTYVDRCDHELKAGGVRGRGQRNPVELTPQEEIVADLVGSGLSNREVATRLFVSPKTVQYHLTRIYAKLGVRTRTELAVLLGQGADDAGEAETTDHDRAHSDRRDA